MRACGDCQLCCKVMPISEIGKPANTRCDHQKFGVGCKIHGTAWQPDSCRRWKCWWLLNPAFEMPRPDRAGYIIDPTPDIAVLGMDVFNASKRVSALQVWADPARPSAWREALSWIKHAIGDKNAVANIRFSETKSIVLVPPQLSDTGEWEEVEPLTMNPITSQALKIKSVEEAAEKASVQVQGVQD